MTWRRSPHDCGKLSRVLKHATQNLHDVTEQRFLALSGVDGSRLVPNLAALNRGLVFWLHSQTTLRLPTGGGGHLGAVFQRTVCACVRAGHDARHAVPCERSRGDDWCNLRRLWSDARRIADQA